MMVFGWTLQSRSMASRDVPELEDQDREKCFKIKVERYERRLQRFLEQ